MNRPHKPAFFRLDDPGIVVTPTEEPRAVVPAESNLPAETEFAPGAPSKSRSPRRIPWGAMFWVSAAGLTLLAMGLGIANLISDLLARSAFLGSVGAALAAVFASGVCAGTMESRNGSAKETPAPFRRERREMNFLVTNMSFSLGPSCTFYRLATGVASARFI